MEQNNLINISNNPTQDNSYLTYNVDKNPNIFLKNIVRDKAADNQIHQQGRIPLPKTTLSFYDPTPVTLTNSVIEVEGSIKEKGLFEKVSNTKYLWDEIYTTPLGNYCFVNFKDTTPSNTMPPDFPILEGDMYYYNPENINNQYSTGMYVCKSSSYNKITEYFYIEGNNKDTIHINISDVNIAPIENDYLVIQILKNVNSLDSTDTESTVDGLNSFSNSLEKETFMFKILSSSNGGSNEKVLVLDKSLDLTSILGKSSYSNYTFKIVLLNRGENSNGKNLYTNTWEFHEIHRKQLLGDLTTTGKNHLQYNGSEYLGTSVLIKEFLKENNSPFILLHFNDNIKDRLSSTKGEIEISFPNLLIQGENPGVVFTNEISLYSKIVGTYSELKLKDSTTNLTRFGWVFNDLRIIIIDDEEVVAALSYNSNRNYTLPGNSKNDYSIMIPSSNRKTNFNRNNPLIITNIVNDNNIDQGVILTFNRDHNFVDGDPIILEGISGDLSVLNKQYNLKTLTNPNQVQLIQAITGSVIAISLNLDGKIYNGDGIAYTLKPDYNYFLTYKIRGEFYNNTLPLNALLPFNFTKGGNINNIEGSLDLTIPKFTHLSDSNNPDKGFNVINKNIEGTPYLEHQYEIIIGTYTYDINDPITVTGVENLRVIPAGLLYEIDGSQKVNHKVSLDASLINSGYITSDLKQIDNPIDSQKIQYHLSLNPDYNSYYAFYPVVPEDQQNSVVNLNDWILIDDNDRSKGGWYNTKCNLYDLTTSIEKLYKTSSNTFLTGINNWLIGNIKYRESINQYRLTINAKILANKWNGTLNPTFDASDPTMSNKLISEIAFVAKQVSKDGTEITYDETPYIYAKINPPIKKSNTSDISLILNIDF